MISGRLFLIGDRWPVFESFCTKLSTRISPENSNERE